MVPDSVPVLDTMGSTVTPGRPQNLVRGLLNENLKKPIARTIMCVFASVLLVRCHSRKLAVQGGGAAIKSNRKLLR